MAVEAIVFAVPITSLAVPILLLSPIRFVNLLSVISLAGGCRLLLGGISGGTESLRSVHRTWWSAAYLGVLLVLCGFVSTLLPPSFPYSQMEIFRQELEQCLIGTPLVLILVHLKWLARGRISI